MIVAGYGMNGKNLARVLRSTHVPYVVVDLNDAMVREGREAGEPIYYGDVNNPEILDRVGVGRARMLVLAISDPMATRRAVAVARRANPGLYILVRTRYVADVDDLIALGANAVIPEEFETSVEIFSRALREYHVPDHVIRQQEELIRSGTYRILRERVAPGGGDMLAEFEEFLRRKVIEVFYISPDSIWGGRTVADLPAGNGALATRSTYSPLASLTVIGAWPCWESCSLASRARICSSRASCSESGASLACSMIQQNTRWSKSSPPRAESPPVAMTSKTPFDRRRMEMSKVPPPRSNTA